MRKWKWVEWLRRKTGFSLVPKSPPITADHSAIVEQKANELRSEIELLERVLRRPGKGFPDHGRR